MIPAIIVGALTAWYLGLRLGIIVAVVTAVALVIAAFVPGLSLAVYGLVLAWAAGLYFFGAKIAKASGQTGMFGGVLGGLSGAAGQASTWAKKLFGSGK